MADLVIKPTSGNLIIKDDQNVARLTIAPTSGATTLSNVTAGTLGSGVTFPAGHLLKVTQNNTYIGGTAYTSGTTTILTTSFTPLSATNNILIKFRVCSQFYGNNSSNDANANYYFYHNGVKCFDSTSSDPDRIEFYDQANSNTGWHRTSQYTHEKYMSVTSDGAGHNARTIKFDVNPLSGRWYVSSELGDQFIQIMEFA